MFRLAECCLNITHNICIYETFLRKTHQISTNYECLLIKLKMNLKEAIEILDYHQSWRLGKVDEMMFDPKQITKALDIVLEEVKKIK